jgi:hypothetical protein
MRFLAVALAWAVVGCGSAEGEPTATGGEPGTGGVVSATGGEPAASSSGGVIASGGTTGGSSTGGLATATGGTVTTGGASTGGMSSGGAETGGAAALGGTGGSFATGGATGGFSTGGVALSTGGQTGGTVATGGVTSSGGSKATGGAGSGGGGECACSTGECCDGCKFRAPGFALPERAVRSYCDHVIVDGDYFEVVTEYRSAQCPGGSADPLVATAAGRFERKPCTSTASARCIQDAATNTARCDPP